MSHVDESLLVAYVDDALDPDERVRVETHLVSCAECRARVEEERALAQRAEAVLGVTVPATQTEMPPFAEIMRRSEQSDATSSGSARGSRPRSWTMPPLAWAAMLVVGLGAAIIARTLLVSPEFNAPVQSSVEQAEPAARSLESRAEADETPDAEGQASDAAVTGAQPFSAGAAARTEAASVEAAPPTAEAADPQPAAQAVPPPPAPAPGLRVEPDASAAKAAAEPPAAVQADPRLRPEDAPFEPSRERERYADMVRQDSAAGRQPIQLRRATPAAPVSPAAGDVVITGQLRDAVTDQPLAGAQVSVAGTRIGTLSDERGVFMLRGVPPGERMLAIEAIGYSSERHALNVVAGDSITTRFDLEAHEVALGEIVVTGAPAAPGAVAIRSADVAWRTDSMTEVRSRGAMAHGMPDVPVTSVWFGRDDAPWRARVVQQDDDVSIEIIEWRQAPGTAGQSGAVGDGRNYLFIDKDGVTFLLRAALPVERLEAIAALLQPLE